MVCSQIFMVKYINTPITAITSIIKKTVGLLFTSLENFCRKNLTPYLAVYIMVKFDDIICNSCVKSILSKNFA